MKNMVFPQQGIDKGTLLVIRGCLIVESLCLLPAAYGVDHSVTSGTSTVDCDTFNGGVSAGDTLTIAGGARGSITLNDCIGTLGNHKDTGMSTKKGAAWAPCRAAGAALLFRESFDSTLYFFKLLWAQLIDHLAPGPGRRFLAGIELCDHLVG